MGGLCRGVVPGSPSPKLRMKRDAHHSHGQHTSVQSFNFEQAKFAHAPCMRSIALSMASRQTQIQEDTYFRVMRLLQESPDLTQRELAERLGVSVGGLNYCLKALMAKGWIKMQNFAQSKNKFGYVYILTPSGMSEKASLTSGFLRRKMDEYEALKAEIAALQSEADHADGGEARKA